MIRSFQLVKHIYKPQVASILSHLSLKQVRMSHLSANPTSGSAPDDAVVLHSTKNHARIITLNRVKKLNSLNTEMVNLITPDLLKYAKEPQNNVIILTTNSPRHYVLEVMSPNAPIKLSKVTLDTVLTSLTRNTILITLSQLYQSHIFP